MAYTPKKIEDASARERLTYARTFLNLDGIDETASDEQVIAAIRGAQPNSPNIFVEELNQEEQDHRAQAARQQSSGNPMNMQLGVAEEGDGEQQKGSLGKDDPRATIFIRAVDQSDGLGGHDVPVGVNGVIWQLKRNEDLNVPWRVVEALGLTDQDIVRHTEEGDVTVTTSRRVVVEFPYGMPSYESIKAWREQTDAKFCP
jgi:hypothetical protein